MIADDLREELKTMSDKDLECTIGYCQGLIDSRGD